MTDIGEGSGAALICTTDQIDCCDDAPGNVRRGEWLYPNGSLVTIIRANLGFYRTRNIGGQVLLHRRNNALQPLGRYCCDVATVDDPGATICVNLGR